MTKFSIDLNTSISDNETLTISEKFNNDSVEYIIKAFCNLMKNAGYEFDLEKEILAAYDDKYVNKSTELQFIKDHFDKLIQAKEQLDKKTSRGAIKISPCDWNSIAEFNIPKFENYQKSFFDLSNSQPDLPKNWSWVGMKITKKDFPSLTPFFEWYTRTQIKKND